MELRGIEEKVCSLCGADTMKFGRNAEKQIVGCLHAHFEVVVDVTDEGDEADPLLQGTSSSPLAFLELQLEPVQQVPPEHATVVLLGLRLSHK